MDDLEQYSWRNRLVLHGVNESNYDNTIEILITFSEELGVKINEDNLDKSWTGKPKRKDNNPQPIIVKFAHYVSRREIVLNKRKLKGKLLLIFESLTSSRMQVRNVWTSDGHVMVKENKVFLYES